MQIVAFVGSAGRRRRSVCCGVCCRVLQGVAVCGSIYTCTHHDTASHEKSHRPTTPITLCVAVCCSVLQCVAVCCSVLQCVLEYTRAHTFTPRATCSHIAPRHPALYVLQYVADCCSVLQCVAVCCSVLQCAAVCCSVLQCVLVYTHAHTFTPRATRSNIAPRHPALASCGIIRNSALLHLFGDRRKIRRIHRGF